MFVVAWNVPDRATRVAVVETAKSSSLQLRVLSLEEYQPLVLRAQQTQTQWKPSYLVLELCTLPRVDGSVPRKVLYAICT